MMGCSHQLPSVAYRHEKRLFGQQMRPRPGVYTQLFPEVAAVAYLRAEEIAKLEFHSSWPQGT